MGTILPLDSSDESGITWYNALLWVAASLPSERNHSSEDLDTSRRRQLARQQLFIFRVFSCTTHGSEHGLGLSLLINFALITHSQCPA